MLRRQYYYGNIYSGWVDLAYDNLVLIVDIALLEIDIGLA